MLFFILAILLNLFVVIFAALNQVGKSVRPSTYLSKIHIYLLALYLVLSIVILIKFSDSIEMWGLEFLIGLFTYFGIFYGFTFLLFALAHRSVTVALISKIIGLGGKATRIYLLKNYNDEEGFRGVIQDRLLNATRLGLVTVRGGDIRTTKFGVFLGMLSIGVLRIFNLKRVGENND